MKVRVLLVSLLLCAAATAGAQAIRSITDVDIRVALEPDGSAWVTQVWTAEAGPSGTEFYIPVGNLGPMRVSDLTVSENGQPFKSLGKHWDVDHSRSWKTGKCGIVPKSDGVELCWGLGEPGPHVWTARFRLTGLVQAYEDADAFNFQFVNRGMEPAPRHARVTVTPAFDTPEWDYTNTRVWAFGFDGEINVKGGAVVAETLDRMDSGSSVICLVRFNKGIFQPTVEKGGPFQALLDKALEGSSYGEDPAEKWFLALFALVFLSGLALLIWVAVSVALGYKWKKSLFGTHKIDGWFRDVPLEGNLPAAYYLLAKGKRFEVGAPANNLIGAFFLRWIMNGQVSVQPDMKHYKRVNLSFRAQEITTGSPVEEALYRMAREAAGANQLLEKGEFEKWSTANYKQITLWPAKALSEGREWFRGKGYFVRQDECSPEGAAQACRLIQFQRFLKEFTLSKERGAAEVGLWKEYLVYAQLFGIAEKVAREFRKLYPAQFAEIAGESGMDPVMLMYTMRWTDSLSTRAFAGAVARAGNVSGTGGHASFGGGGGFSGGGFGGGGR